MKPARRPGSDGGQRHDTNRYLTLGMTEPDHCPRGSAVDFTDAGYRTFDWISSTDAQHFKNITARSAVAIVIFDSTAEIGHGRAVYRDADAAVVPDEDLPRRCRGARAVAPATLTDGRRCGCDPMMAFPRV